MDPRRLTGPVSADRPFGRRAGDSARPAQIHSAAFVAQVAGLSLPEGSPRPAQTYLPEPAPPVGLVKDARA
jgi:hypothetical protein